MAKTSLSFFCEPVFWFWFSISGPFSAKKTLRFSLADKFWWLLSFCFLMWGDILILPSHPSDLFSTSSPPHRLRQLSVWAMISCKRHFLKVKSSWPVLLIIFNGKGLAETLWNQKDAFAHPPECFAIAGLSLLPPSLVEQSQQGRIWCSSLQAARLQCLELAPHPKCWVGNSSWNLCDVYLHP